MSLTIAQHFLIYLLHGVIGVIWLIDKYLVFSVQHLAWAARKSKYLVLLVVDICFLSFLFFSINSGYLSKLTETMIVVPSGGRSLVLSNVLGATEKVELPILVQNIAPPGTTAKGIIVLDVDNKKTLFEHNSKEVYAPASTTKIMTALVSLDIYELDEELEISGECTLVESTRANLPAGKKFTVKDLISSLLIASAGDSACVLSTSKVSYSEFISLMNQKAQSIGMEDTHFTNPIGLDALNGEHHSTASDLLKMSLKATEIPEISEIVKTPNYTVEAVDSDFSADLVNTNWLLWQVPNSVGIKTGTTEKAGEVLLYEYDDGEKDVVIVLMGSEDRFGETKMLLDWILASYSWAE